MIVETFLYRSIMMPRETKSIGRYAERPCLMAANDGDSDAITRRLTLRSLITTIISLFSSLASVKSMSPLPSWLGKASTISSTRAAIRSCPSFPSSSSPLKVYFLFFRHIQKESMTDLLDRGSEYAEYSGHYDDTQGLAALGRVRGHGWRGTCALLPTNPAHFQPFQKQEWYI